MSHIWMSHVTYTEGPTHKAGEGRKPTPRCVGKRVGRQCSRSCTGSCCHQKKLGQRCGYVLSLFSRAIFWRRRRRRRRRRAGLRCESSHCWWLALMAGVDVAPCCTVLHRVAVCSTVLHHVAVCCSVLHCVNQVTVTIWHAWGVAVLALLCAKNPLFRGCFSKRDLCL